MNHNRPKTIWILPYVFTSYHNSVDSKSILKIEAIWIGCKHKKHAIHPFLSSQKANNDYLSHSRSERKVSKELLEKLMSKGAFVVKLLHVLIKRALLRIGLQFSQKVALKRQVGPYWRISKKWHMQIMISLFPMTGVVMQLCSDEAVNVTWCWYSVTVLLFYTLDFRSISKQFITEGVKLF